MAFVDELTFQARAGRGGDGVIRWRHQKETAKGGPAGGDGGRGGSVFALGVRDLGALASYRYEKEFFAERGEDGGSNDCHGKSGKDLFIRVPVGSIITLSPSGKQFEVLHEGEEVLLLQGGQGGLGNANFKSSTNQYPTEVKKGRKGEEAEVHVELRLIVDIGFIGIPNAGKSSLLNALTNAKSKIGAYPFTTLEPHLGDFYGHIIADIPGLIEGASSGRGLGHKFLRHTARTKALFHLVSVEQEDPIADWKTVRDELASHDTLLAEKEEIVVLSKCDLATPGKRLELREAFLKEGRDVWEVTVTDPASVKVFSDRLAGYLQSKKGKEGV